MLSKLDYKYEFPPVAHDRVRYDGWTPERQPLFLIAPSALSTVDTAAQAAGMLRISAYNHKKRADAGSFADEWGRALGFGRDMMFDYALERAIYGVITIKMRLGGAFEFQTGPYEKHLMKVMRVPPLRRDAKARPRAS